MFHNDNCGSYKRVKPVINGVFGVNDLNKGTKPHFQLLKLKVDDGKIFSEQQLTENRSGLTLDEHTKICAHYRYTFGTGYKPKKTFQHPHHTQQPKQIKAAPTRVAFFSVIDRITKNYGVQFPIVSIQIPFVTHTTRRNQFPKCLSRNQDQLWKKMIQITFQRWWCSLKEFSLLHQLYQPTWQNILMKVLCLH